MKQAVTAAFPSGLPASVPVASSSPEPDLTNARSFGDRPRRSELAALYRRMADTFERSAKLAEHHADWERRQGRRLSAELELLRAERAREGARRGRALAARLM